MASISSPSSFLFPDHSTSYAGPENARGPRALLPRSQKVLDGPSAGPGLADRRAKRSRTNVTVACDVCKHARTKCDGKSPCERCGKRALSCIYDHGNDRRQNRGSNEEVAALTGRLVQYQKLVFALCNSSVGVAGVTLQHLRSPSNDIVTSMDEVNPVVEDIPLAAAAGLLHETRPERLAHTDIEEISALVGWIKHDLDASLTQANRTPSPTKETLADR